jgi:hypothetical protein
MNLNHCVIDSSPQQFCRIVDSHLFHHAGPVCFHGLNADLEPLSYLFVLKTCQINSRICCSLGVSNSGRLPFADGES